MASILRVNTLTDASSNNSVSLETVSQGSAKNWSNVVGAGTGFNDSFNASSVEDTAAGIIVVNYTNNMANNDGLLLLVINILQLLELVLFLLIVALEPPLRTE